MIVIFAICIAYTAHPAFWAIGALCVMFDLNNNGDW